MCLVYRRSFASGSGRKMPRVSRFARNGAGLMPSTMAWFFFVSIFEGALVKKPDTRVSVLDNYGV